MEQLPATNSPVCPRDGTKRVSIERTQWIGIEARDSEKGIPIKQWCDLRGFLQRRVRPKCRGLCATEPACPPPLLPQPQIFSRTVHRRQRWVINVQRRVKLAGLSNSTTTSISGTRPSSSEGGIKSRGGRPQVALQRLSFRTERGMRR